LYQDKNVPEYLIIDVDERRVERWCPNDAEAATLALTLEWQPDRFLEALIIDLPRYFARVMGTAAL
jgi:Uma2 family endonuclease